ncbi:MAG: hypothetical protein JST86_20370 [Bacteroidetes bacterium]|nr:hypothetical protein [Bacteroidota bacterium]
MKTNVPCLAGVLSALLLLNACTSSKNSIDFHKPEPLAAKSPGSCFVQLKDGSFKNYASLKLVTGIFKTPHLVADGNIVIESSDIKAYQDNQQFAVSQKEFTQSKPGFVAVDALPGFAVRIVKGRLNVYAAKFYNGHNATEKYYLQNGDEGAILAYTPDIMRDMVKDNTVASSFFSTKNKQLTGAKKMLATVDIYNNPKEVSKN